jgi:hypothetical protein
MLYVLFYQQADLKQASILSKLSLSVGEKDPEMVPGTSSGSLSNNFSFFVPHQIIRKQKSKNEQQVEEPEWQQPQSCSTEVADEAVGGSPAPRTLWVSPP